jgi:phosphatidylinositol phospholipase C, gamma-1
MGSQMIALNYQTPDKPMQILMGKFRDNGGCGYRLKPNIMLMDDYDPNDPSYEGLDQVLVTLRIIAARHLFKSGRTNISSPLVEVEVLGAPYDSGIKHRTKAISDNGFNPIWNEICEFRVRNSAIALLRFEVQDEGKIDRVVWFYCGRDAVAEKNGLTLSLLSCNCIILYFIILS